MRRKQRELTDQSAIENILKKTAVCYLGLAEGGQPYVVPLHFGYKDNALYLHSALSGKKVDILKNNPRVSFTVVADYEVVLGEVACASTTKYQSVIGLGVAQFLIDDQEKIDALNVIMKHQGWDIAAHPINCGKSIANVLVIKIVIDSMTGKANPNQAVSQV